MSNNKPLTICAIGEILWDIFPQQKLLGGAPGNFIFYANQHNTNGTLYSAVGFDNLGAEILEETHSKLHYFHLEKVPFPTGFVNISLDSNGNATYKFNENCAWDNLPFNHSSKKLAELSDLIVFGTLAQRNPHSRETITQFLNCRQPHCKVLFDINLRQNFYNKEIIHNSLFHCNYLKLNEEEAEIVIDLLKMPLGDLFHRYNIELIILTLGEKGNKILNPSQEIFAPSSKIKIVDTVGAGDSFTATFIIHYLKYKNIAEAQTLATKVAEFVCQNNGAMVNLPESLKLK